MKTMKSVQLSLTDNSRIICTIKGSLERDSLFVRKIITFSLGGSNGKIMSFFSPFLSCFQKTLELIQVLGDDIKVRLFDNGGK